MVKEAFGLNLGEQKYISRRMNHLTQSAGPAHSAHELESHYVSPKQKIRA
jgi:hypothetical protein